MHLYPSHVTDDLKDQAAEHRNPIAPCASVFDGQRDLGGHGEAKDGRIQSIASKVGYVVDMRQGKGAGLECAQIGVVE